MCPEDRESTRFIPVGKGKRLIILDAGSAKSGFIKDVGLIFRSKTKSADYHDEMNGQHFIEWFEHTLIPALSNPSVIVLDNAPYHNIKTQESWYPRKSSSKAQIQEWLEGKGIHVEDGELKDEMLQTVRMHKPAQIYRTDTIAERNGHLVLRLPVRHCELNPIEIIQAHEKQIVAHANTTFKLADVERIFHEAKASIGIEEWQKVERHVIRLKKS